MEKEKITQEKAKRIAVGGTVGGVLLLFFLLVILIILLVQIGVRNGEKAEYERNIEQYKAWIDADQKKLDDYLNGDALYYLAVERGWKSH